MRRTALVGIALLLVSCGSGDKPAAKKESAAPATAQAPAKQPREAGVLALDESQQRRVHIVVEAVRTKTVSEKVSAQGQLALNEDRIWHVGAVASGRVSALPVRLGDSVRRGQIVGRIHSHDEHEARAAYQQATTELNRAKAAQAFAVRRRDRARRLLELRAGSRQDVENAEAELSNTEAGIEKAQAQVVMEQTHLTDILHVAVMEETAKTLPGAGGNAEEGIPIFAPASGVVFERKATEGSVLNTGDEVLSVADTSSIWMIAAVNEVDLSKIRPGQSARVQVRAYPGRDFMGRILKLGEKLDPETRTLQVRVAIPNPQGMLKPEMYATAAFEQAEHRAALFVPEAAVQEINGVPAVFVRRSATEFQSRAVRTGQRDGGEVEILEGLTMQDSVVVKGSFVLKSELLKSTLEEN